MATHYLPIQSTPFVGRTQELAEIAALLNDPNCRLLTLVGPGGIGKTRLAIEAVAHLDTYPDGIYFVSLQPLSSPNFIIPAIAEAVDLHFYANGDRRQQLLDYFKKKSLLLVLDNFEHLLEGVEFISAILSQASEVKILITSRETLNLREEWLYPVNGLAFPQVEAADEIETYSAVQLFFQNARRVRPYFSLDGEHEAVVRICQLVEGLPLALEMTAAWVKRLPCQVIAAEIGHGLSMLESPARNISPRHHSMRAVCDHSWNLLDASERNVFKKLSVFRGGFYKEAAQAVVGATLNLLSALVDKSLLRVNPDGRYDLHELLRQYAEEQLKTSPAESDQVYDLHCAFYADLMQQRESDLKGRRQLAALNEIEADFENVCAMWLWALRQKRHDLLNQTAGSLFLFCEMRGHFQEGKELFQQGQLQLATILDTSVRPIWGQMVPRCFWFWEWGHYVPEHYEAIRTQMEASLVIAQESGDLKESAFCLWMLGIYHFLFKEFSRSVAYLEQSLTLFSSLDERFYMARAADWLGAACGMNRQHDRFIQLSQYSLNLRRALGDRFGVASSLMNLAQIALDGGQFAEAERYLEEMGVIYAEMSGRGWIGRQTAYLACGDFFQGNFLKAQTRAEDVLKTVTETETFASEIGTMALAVLGLLATLEEDYAKSWQLCQRAVFDFAPLIILVDLGLAAAACGLDDYPTAKHHLLNVLRFGVLARSISSLTTALPIAATVLMHEQQPVQAVELLGLAFHHPASAKKWLQEWPLLTRLRAALQAELSPPIYAAAWERGKSSDPEIVVLLLVEQLQMVQSDSPQQRVTKARTANRSLVEPFSDRELDVLRLLASGLSNRDIAGRLFIGESTVKKHINHIYSKLGVGSRTQALVLAEKLHLL